MKFKKLTPSENPHCPEKPATLVELKHISIHAEKLNRHPTKSCQCEIMKQH